MSFSYYPPVVTKNRAANRDYIVCCALGDDIGYDEIH